MTTAIVAWIGGDGVRTLPAVPGLVIRRFPSSGDGGIRGRRSAVASIERGAMSLVIIHVRWLAHGDFESVRRACREVGIPYRVITGGLASVRRALNDFVATEQLRVH